MLFTRPVTFVLLLLNLVVFRSMGFSQDASTKPQWLVVTTVELAKAIEPLKNRRKQQGFLVNELVASGDSTGEEWASQKIVEWIRGQKERHNGPTSVLLVGDWNLKNKTAYLPSSKGIRGRMSGQLTDHGYGLPDDDGVPTIAVGRIPARSSEEVGAFIEKVSRFEDQGVGSWTNQLNLWIGHPGGNSAIEKRLGETIIQTAVNKSLNRLNAMWSGNCLIDFPGTPYSVDRIAFRERMKGDLSKGCCFTIYAGHSGAEGVWSEDQFVFSKQEWSKLKIESSPGVILTTGCFACQVVGNGGEGYLTTAIRNPNGPAACIGAFAESYAAHGQLALDAFVELTSLPSPRERLGDYWLSMQQGIGRGKLDQLTFWLYDQADGSRGKVPLNAQRLEHLEMWTLLGDPALKIPYLIPTIELTVKAMTGSTEVAVEFAVPAELVDGQVELQVRHVPTLNKRKSRSTQPATKVAQPFQFSAGSGVFKEAVSMPEPLADGKLEVRLMLVKNGKGALGITSIELKSE